MSLSIWRFAHLALAVISALFLLILSATGIILAIDAVNENLPDFKTNDSETLTLAETLPVLQEVYPEILEITVHPNGFVSIDATDPEGNSINAYIDPHDGKILGPVQPKSDFIQWNIALHRSLFLKETGRIIVGIVSFLLVLIAVSGTVLIIKRQQGLRNFFAKIQRDFLSQYLHVVTGRLMLIPVLIIAITGTYLFLIRIGIILPTSEEFKLDEAEQLPRQAWADFEVFQQTQLGQVEKIDFPFLLEDEDEPFILKLKDRVLTVNQLTGAVIQESRHPNAVVWEQWSMDLHTGRTSILWAIILGFASLNILVFIYTGFKITFRRLRTKIRNRYGANEAEFIVLTGSENGSTLFFANEIHRQLLAEGKKSHLTEMNRFSTYPKANHLLVFTSTHGLGTAPANAIHFEKLVDAFPARRKLKFSVVGFGSKAYPDFCGYARQVDRLLERQGWAERHLDMHTVNDRSTHEFTQWIAAWNAKTGTSLSTTPARYSMSTQGITNFTVTEVSEICTVNNTFKIFLKPNVKIRFRSGDLLAIYPGSEGRERLYSIGKWDDQIQLIVKLYPGGLGSEFLCRLKPGDLIKARILRNPGFHFPRNAPNVVMICNGTGIAPFLGMVRENHKQTPVSLYAGFRYENTLVDQYRNYLNEEVAKKHLHQTQWAFSRGEKPCYVMDLIRDDAAFVTDVLENNGVVMICGSLSMQKDVEGLIDQLCRTKTGKPLAYYQARGLVKADCY